MGERELLSLVVLWENSCILLSCLLESLVHQRSIHYCHGLNLVKTTNSARSLIHCSGFCSVSFGQLALARRSAATPFKLLAPARRINMQAVLSTNDDKSNPAKCGQAGQPTADCRLTRSRSRELVGGTEILRDSSLGQFKFDLFDLPDLGTMPPPDSVALTSKSESKDVLLKRSESKKTVHLGTSLLRDSSFGKLSFDMSDLIAADLFPAEAVPQVAPVVVGMKRNAADAFQQLATNHNEQGAANGVVEDEWVGKNVILTRGKYTGRTAFVLGKATKKYRVQVEGVPYQLEFFCELFCRPEEYKPPPPKKPRKNKKKTA